MELTIRHVNPGDYPSILELIQELAGTVHETSPATKDYLREYLSHPTSHMLVAERADTVIGLLNFSIRPNLYHAGNSCHIEDFVVTASARGQGVGKALMRELLKQADLYKCVEIGVATENKQSVSFYHSFGLMDQSLYLERHNY